MKKWFCWSIVSIFALLISATSGAAQAWYDTDWPYRVPISISNPSSMDLVDYQVKLILENPFNFSVALPDGSDLRVTDEDETTLIPFWIENWDPAAELADIWVKVPELPAMGSKTIYLYYGNPSPPGPEMVETPPIGPWTRGEDYIRPIGDPNNGSGLLAENIVYDEASGHYWLVFANYRNGSVGLMWSDDPSDHTAWNWHANGTVIPSANAPHLIEHDGTWYIFYADRAHGGPPYPISVSSSSSIGGPYDFESIVLSSTEAWEGYRVDEPYVFQRADGKWILVYMGDEGSTTEIIGYASADDILGPYTKFAGNPCIDFGPPGSYDAGTVADPWVVEFQGTYYIGYTVSATKSSPWRTAYATTTDWQIFTKNAIILDWGPVGAWDQCNSFRGAVTRFVDTYYFPYVGRFCSGGSYLSGIATQPAYMPLEIGTCDQVFEFCDTFEGDALDSNKWSREDTGTGHAVNVSNGILEIQSQAGSQYGFVQMRGNKPVGTGTLLEASARHETAVLDCDADTDTDNAGEIGYKTSDMGWSNVIRIMDYPNALNYTVQSANNGVAPPPAPGYIETLIPLSDQWQQYSIYRNDAGSVEFDIDNSGSPETLIPPYVPIIDMYPWLMSYAEPCAGTSLFEVDWVRVRKFCGIEPTVSMNDEQLIQTIFDLAARAKSGKVQLIWSNVEGATCYNIYRSIGNDSSFSIIAQCHVTDYCTYLDTDVVDYTTYYYFVRSVTGMHESGGSNQVNATPQSRIRR
jgi:hypothetical protein